jgi:hypothetical protein
MKITKLKLIAFTSLFALMLSLATVVSADGVRKRLRFAKGKSSATVSGGVIRGDQDTYLIGARQGQTMGVVITSPEKNAVFQVQAPDGEFLQNAGEEDDATNWTGNLPESGDYKIVVGGTRGNASYRLTVSIR